MAENLSNALLVTAIGMGLVFAAILLLWGVMDLLVRLTSKNDLPAKNEEAEAEVEEELRYQAAAVAVAMALAKNQEVSQVHEFPLPPTATVSPWQAVMRSRIMNKRGSTR